MIELKMREKTVKNNYKNTNNKNQNNSDRLSCTFCVSVTMLSTLHTSYLNLQYAHNIANIAALLVPFYRWGKADSER